MLITFGWASTFGRRQCDIRGSHYPAPPEITETDARRHSGLGIARNKEDKLAGLGSFGSRINTYSSSPSRSGLHDRLLDLLAGSNEALRSRIQARLLDAETALTDARAYPLLTEATEIEGLRRFIEIWAAPWIAQMLADARQHPGSVLDRARLLLEVHAASLTGDTTTYLATWKAAVKRAIPEGVNAREFRATLDRLDQRSQRKNSSIEQDLANLRTEMQSGLSHPQVIDSAVDAVRGLYLAGMATMRLSAMAAKIIPEKDLLALVNKLLADPDRNGDSREEIQQNRNRMYWHYLDPDLTLSKKYDQLSTQMNDLDAVNFDKLRADSLAVAASGLLMFIIDYVEGRWHLRHGHNELAEQCLQRVVARADGRQLGKIAADAASILIALRLAGPCPLKFAVLNPLMRVRIENMPQSTEMYLDSTPTPFSDWSPRPKPSFYDSHIMKCVAFFNDVTCAPGVSAICNPLRRFDASLENLITQSRQAGASLAEARRKQPAIVGTSIKPYQVLRDHLYYRNELFGLNPSNLPGMDAYWKLPPSDQRRLLHFVDPEAYQLDLRAHNLSPSQDSIEFGYDDFYAYYLGVPYNRGLIELSRAQVIHPSDFSVHEPRHLCLAALHGHIIYPIDKGAIEASVGDDSPYAKTIVTRMENFREMVADFNAEQKRFAPYTGGEIQMDIDDDPITPEQFEIFGLGESAIAKASLQYERDRKYFELGRSERLNHFAQEYGFANLEKLKEFLDRLDIEAREIGYESYTTICTSIRFMDYLKQKYSGQASMTSALDALHQKRGLLQQQSAFTIERYLACRIVGSREPYYVDINDEGVLIELREGRFAGAGVVSSRFLSGRNDLLHSVNRPGISRYCGPEYNGKLT